MTSEQKNGTRITAPPLTLDQIRLLPAYRAKLPSRAEHLAALERHEFDLLVIGGGASGAGAALEAASRGLSVALVEAQDFSSGTSSRSTKLIHGGVRYLEKAVMKLDRTEYALVHEGLRERAWFLRLAPHLTRELRLITPCYRAWQVPYFFAGLFLYDRVAGRESLTPTGFVDRDKLRQWFPDLKQSGLKGGIAYSDGEFNDSRVNVGLAQTAAWLGATVANHVEVVGLLKNEAGRLRGAALRDRKTGRQWECRAKAVLNATGPFLDRIRRMDRPEAPELVVPSAGTHIWVRKLQIPHGILIPKAPNGSVAFFKPFEGGTLIGTTEEPTEITEEPRTTEQHVQYLLEVANLYLEPASALRRQDVSAVWTGIRPLVREPDQAARNVGTAQLSRNHILEVSLSGLVTLGGGKWTSFGRMAREAVDLAIKTANLGEHPTRRESLRLLGSHGWSGALAGQLAEGFELPLPVAEHLAHNYGDRAVQVAELAGPAAVRLHPDYPYLEAEVTYGALHEYAADPVDVLSRRTRLYYVDEAAALGALPRVVELMAQALGWEAARAAEEESAARVYMQRNALAGAR